MKGMLRYWVQGCAGIMGEGCKGLRVRVRYFGSLYGYLGVFEDIISLSRCDASVEDVLRAVKLLRPELGIAESVLPMIWIYLNGRQVLNPSRTRVRDGDVILLTPPLYEGG